MRGRHQAAPRRRRTRLRWLVGVAGGAVVGATMLAFSSAGATTDPVVATFSVTGVVSSNCPNLDIGGGDVYVAPGQELDAKTSVAGLNLLGLNVSLLDLKGTLTVDPNTASAKSYDLTKTKAPISGLTTGNHAYSFTATSVAGLPLGVTLSSLLQAGAKLTWAGTIHVTADAAKCGVAVSLPSASASVSVTGLPPIAIGVPGVKVSVPVNIPTALPTSLPTGGAKAPGGGHSGSGAPPADSGNEIPVPAQVVPGLDGGGLLGSGGGYTGVLPGTGSGAGSSLVGAADSAPAAQPAEQNSTGKHKTIDLAASRASSTGEVWVVLAIVAVIALAFVAATYARLYLMKHES
jgi:hypothetical protein